MWGMQMQMTTPPAQRIKWLKSVKIGTQISLKSTHISKFKLIFATLKYLTAPDPTIILIFIINHDKTFIFDRGGSKTVARIKFSNSVR